MNSLLVLMNNIVKFNLSNFVLVLLFIMTTNIIQAQNKNTSSSFLKEEIMHLDFDVNINIPKIKDRYKSTIISHQKKTGEQYIKQGYKVETTRKGEVLIISIPAHELFAPNSSQLMDTASKWLSSILPLAKSNRMYKLLIAMHSDNTGSEQYLDCLTNDRIVAIYEWFKNNSNNMGIIVPYAMGNSEPIMPNNSRINRQVNRRLEIYVVPEEQMIERAKTNKLSN